ncbi:hypothetical protein [Bosea sp. RAC05]|uniref:hypothetical protein n=1 Tax=Bosea sp. RAC05 TaxID=1842539 RepID=UPI0012370CDA|nr:hypothetical protein [Bosea sp. RAC05]
MRPARISMHEPQWFVFHQRSHRSDGSVVNIGHLSRIAEAEVDLRKALVPDCIGYIGAGHDLEEALRRAVAIDQHGGWEFVDRVSLAELDYLEIGAGEDRRGEARSLLPEAFVSSSMVGIRTSDMASLDTLGRAGISFTAAASTLTGNDMWPEDPMDEDVGGPTP